MAIVNRDGQVVQLADINYIRVHRTDQDASDLLSQVRSERRASGVFVMGIPDEWYAASKGDDVTDKFITGPPGNGTTATGSARLDAPGATSSDHRAVFVVHGPDLSARTAMFEFLRSLDLKPIEWNQAIGMTGKGSPYVGEVLNAAFSHAQAVIVLMTPDDEARLAREFVRDGEEETEGRLTRQARPNVMFEAGMAIGYGEARTILVETGRSSRLARLVVAMRFSGPAARLGVTTGESGLRRQQKRNRLAVRWQL